MVKELIFRLNVAQESWPLSPHLDGLVAVNQSAFVKGRSLHYNFHFVQLAAKALHARRTPRLLHRVDIANAFDTVS
jgi:hypothetical protein